MALGYSLMKLYNTFSKQKEEFKPLNDNEVRMYTCGPTVYDFAHIGNFRSYLAVDFLRRTLEYLDYKVIQVKNITDVGHLTQDDIDEGEDKITKAAREKKVSPEDIARSYEKAFREDEEKLNIKQAEFYPRATENIPEMIKAIQELIAKGYAYEKDGAVFFDISKFNNYGKLSGNTLEKLKSGSRIKPNTLKKNQYDFYLWRPAEKEHIMNWLSPWGEGYPGWHIECSVMSKKYLESETLDIHSGGEDNIFPHHENEIAQSESLNDKKFVNYWFHSGYLLVEGEKMAKSKNNFYTLRDLEEKQYDPLAFRLLAFGTHYRSPFDFSFSSLNQAVANLGTIKEFTRRLKNASSETPESIDDLFKQTKEGFREALENDLDTPKALSVIFELIKKVNSLIDDEKISQEQAKIILNLMLEFNQILGLDLEEEIPEEIVELAQRRKGLRKERRFAEADKARKEILSKGYEVSDLGDDFIIRKK